MFVRMTFTKTDPAHSDEAIALFNSEQVSGVIGQQKGHRFHYLLQSVEDPTEGVTVTAWDSREDAEAYAQQSGPFKELLGKFTRWHTRPAEVRTYEVVGGGE